MGISSWLSSVVVGMLLAIPAMAQQATVESIGFKTEGSTSVLEITGDQPLLYDLQENPADSQVIFNFSGASLSSNASRKLDTSSFNSPVSLVSPYQVDGEDQVRVVVQLRNPSTPKVESSGNILRVVFGGENVGDADLPDGEEAPTEVSTGPSGDDPASKKIDSFIESRKTKRFIGSKITLNLRDANVRDVLRLIGEASGFNIVLGPAVGGNITLSLGEVPWDQALDVVLSTMKLGAERNINILRILTLSNLTQEKQEQLEAKLAAQANAPRVTRVFPISYANPGTLQGIIAVFGASQVPSGSSVPVSQPTVQTDLRTNSLIVQDIPENLERITKLIEILDTETPQVLVEAKVVEASENFSRSIGGNLGLGRTSGATTNPQGLASFAGGNPVDGLIGSAGVFADGKSVANATVDSGSVGFSLGFLNSTSRLNALLTLGESDQQVSVVSAPRTVVLDQQPANILQTIPVIIESSTVTDGVPIVTKQVLQANLQLNVTPQVTNDESVLLNLSIQRDVPIVASNGDQAVAIRNINTQVLVESGSTLVIGGIYTMDKSKVSGGFPLLRHVPILGLLFGTDTTTTTRSELFIFVTPRILNAKRAGIAT